MKALVAIILLTLSSAAHAQVTQEWVARYDGPEGYYDDASATAVDDSGNV
jgi:hypothetical protein